MIVGVTREIKMDEYRVAMLPVGAHLLTQDGHTLLIEKGAGLGSGYDDKDYAAAGARLVNTPEEIFNQAEMIIKVKEPQPEEIKKLHKGQMVFCYFHFAGSRTLTEACLKSGISAMAYETLAVSTGISRFLHP